MGLLRPILSRTFSEMVEDDLCYAYEQGGLEQLAARSCVGWTAIFRANIVFYGRLADTTLPAGVSDRT